MGQKKVKWQTGQAVALASKGRTRVEGVGKVADVEAGCGLGQPCAA